MLAASARSISLIQLISTICSISGLWVFDFDTAAWLMILLGYFLYSGVGISMMMHRYWTHRSFEFKSKWIMWICTWFAIVAGRGSPIGWVYVHRLHHAYSDTSKDPHGPDIVGWKLFFPHLIKYGEIINTRLIRDLLTRTQLYINRYYLAFIMLWSLVLLAIDPKLLYFFYIIPLMFSFISLNLFVLLTHRYGYINFEGRDNSKNNWVISLILWGEGWHNNHHNNPASYSTKVKWWEIDLLGIFISFLKK